MTEKGGDPMSVRHLRPDAMPPIQMGEVFVDEGDDVEVGFLDKELADLLNRLRVPFPDNEIETRVGARGITLEYVGHATTTNRMLDVDLLWTWEPLALDADGLPKFDRFGGLWIKLTVCGVTRLGYGDAVGKEPGTTAVKEIIGDALRNAAMRFGVALDLWSKIDRQAHVDTSSDREGHADVATKQEPAHNQEALDSLASVCDDYGYDQRTMRARYAKWAHSQSDIPGDEISDALGENILAFAAFLIETSTPEPDAGPEAGTVADPKPETPTGVVGDQGEDVDTSDVEKKPGDLF